MGSQFEKCLKITCYYTFFVITTKVVERFSWYFIFGHLLLLGVVFRHFPLKAAISALCDAHWDVRWDLLCLGIAVVLVNAQ